MKTIKMLPLILIACYALVSEAKEVAQKSERKKGALPVSVAQVQMSLRETIDNLIDAYKNKELTRFMVYVSDDFTGDKTILEGAVRKDFSAFHNIDVRYSLNNITIDSSGTLLSVSLNFTRFHTEIKTGNLFTSNETTEMVFKMVDGEPKLYRMNKPLMFGISN